MGGSRRGSLIPAEGHRLTGFIVCSNFFETLPSYKGCIYYLKGPNLIIKTTSPNIFWLSNTCLSKCNIKLLATFGNSKNGLLVTFRILPNGLTLEFTKIVDQMSTYFKGQKT